VYAIHLTKIFTKYYTLKIFLQKLQNGKNTPRPEESNHIADIIAAIQPLIRYLSKINKIYKIPTLRDIYPTPYLLKEPEQTKYSIIMNDMIYRLEEYRVTILYNIRTPPTSSLSIFAANLYDLCSRYDLELDLEIWTLRKPLMSTLNRLCGHLIEYWTSPLFVDSLSLGYFTQQRADQIFSANYDAFKHIWYLPGIIGPDIHNKDLNKIIIWSLMSLYLYPNTYYFLILQDQNYDLPELISHECIQHWCRIKEIHNGILKFTNIWIISINKLFDKNIYQELNKNLKNDHVHLFWTPQIIKNSDFNVQNILKAYPDIAAPWQSIYAERKLNLFFGTNINREKQIEGKNFNFLPFTVTPNFPFKNTVETFYHLNKINITAFKKLENMLGLCLKKTISTTAVPNFLLTEKILEVKWKYRQWVITICDKNPNLQLPMCPVQYHNDMKKMFVDNKSMFKIISSTKYNSDIFEEEYISKLQKKHKKEWSHLGKIKITGDLSTAYTLPKFSDIDKKLQSCRVRPIITYAKFAMKKTLSIVAIGLNFLLSRLNSNMHYDICETSVVKKNMEDINHNLPFGDSTGLMLLQADIESMFDNIEPIMVEESLDWLFKEIRKIKRTDRIAINFQDRTARFGRAYGDNYEIKFCEIFQLVQYMLNNSYVKVGSEFLAKQIRGLPQGSPPSPPLARLVCIKREWQWKNSITLNKNVSGMRFMDDVYMLFFYNFRTPTSKQDAEKLRENFKKECYYSQWNLKEVDNNIFLSTECQWDTKKITIKWANKNKDSIKNNKQKIIRFLHSKSFTANYIKTNSIYSQFLRIARNSDEVNVLKDFEDLMKEYELLGYRKALIQIQKQRVMEKINK
jgi:hypothetical protein